MVFELMPVKLCLYFQTDERAKLFVELEDGEVNVVGFLGQLMG